MAKTKKYYMDVWQPRWDKLARGIFYLANAIIIILLMIMNVSTIRDLPEIINLSLVLIIVFLFIFNVIEFVINIGEGLSGEYRKKEVFVNDP